MVFHDPVQSHDELVRYLDRIEYKLGVLMTTQEDIDAATAALVALTGDVATNVAQLGTDLANIQAALANIPPTVDTTALDAAVANASNTQANLDASVKSVTDAVPAAPAAPSSGPVGTPEGNVNSGTDTGAPADGQPAGDEGNAPAPSTGSDDGTAPAAPADGSSAT